MNDRGLPVVLASPPWLSTARKPAPIVIDPPPSVAFEAEVHWSDNEREDALEPLAAWKSRHSSLHEWVGPDVPVYRVHILDDAQALTVWNETDPNLWCYSMPGDLLTMLARFGVAGTRGLIRYASRDPHDAFPALLRLESPDVAPLMSLWATKSTALGTWGKQWLLTYPRAALTGLVPLALGPLGPQRAAAESALRLIAHHRPEETSKTLEPFGDAVARAIGLLLSADPLINYPEPLPKLPTWWDAAAVRKPRLKDGTELPDGAVEALALMLRFSPVDPPYAGLEQTRMACDTSSLDAFAWDLASLWIANGSAPAAYWALHGLGHLGGDQSARELAKMIWVWPQQRGLAKAKLGVEVLARIGSDTALMHLDRLARNVRKSELKEHAQEAIRQVAQARGFSAEQLGDRLVPTLGLDEGEGGRLDFGTRVLHVRFDEALRPYVIDEEGNRAKSVRALKTDDPTKSKAAIERWKGLKKDAESCAQHQVRRLERALSDRRRWSADEFVKLFANHPLLTYLARRLIWAGHDEAGTLQCTFRVAEDGTLADVNDDAWVLPPDAAVRLAHPLELGPGSVESWRRVFLDYEIIQPFRQIERPCYRLDDAEARTNRLVSFEKKELYSGALLSLDLTGWTKGAIEDGWIRSYSKPVGNNLSVVITFSPGLWVTSPMEHEIQVLEAVYLRPSRTFEELDPVTYSELALTLEGCRVGTSS